MDASTGEIAAQVLTDGDDDNAVQAPALLRQCQGTLASVTADGAYDRDPVHQAAVARQPGPAPEVVIPPRADAVLGTADLDQQTPRDRHIQLVGPAQTASRFRWGSPDMAERGRIGG